MKNNLEYEEIIKLLVAKMPFPGQKEATVHLSKILRISETSIYNKFNGRSKFTTEEIFIICKQCNISLDSILHHSDKERSFVPYFSDGLKYTPRNYADYLNNIISYYSQIKKMPEVKGYFLASEVPLFHFLFFPNLFYLKMYIWNDMNWNMSIYSNEYRPKEFINNTELSLACKALKELFYSFPSEEIWNPSMIDITISQFLYLKQMQIIKDEEQMELIKNELNELLNYLENLSNTGTKFISSDKESAPIDLYITDLSLGSELILVKSKPMNMLFQQLDAPNYIRSTDEKMCDYVWKYYNKIKKRSTHITKTGEKDKSLFFKKMREQLGRLK
jgi:hypothetical protein